jgi:predicted ATPase
MFKKFYLRNFKIWGDQLWKDGVELAPVTLFLGANSAGKTSLLQLPLLLKQTFDSPDRHLDLNLGGQPTDIIDLGSYEDLIHDHDTKLELGMGVELEDSQDNGMSSRVTYRVQHSLAGGSPTVQEMEFIVGEARFGVNRQPKGAYLLSVPGYAPKDLGKRQDARRNFKPERSLEFSPEALSEIGEAGKQVQDLSLRMRQAVRSIAYLGPLRERPERSYTWNQQNPFDLGTRGERAVYALLASTRSLKKQISGNEGGRGWLVDRVSNWLSRLGVADGLMLEQQGRSRHYEVMVRGEKRDVNLMDVGFGISQVLPMLVLAYFVPRGTTILAEEPEIHLHPRAQVGLAELMVEVAKERGVQFLVESHSEHMFRRLQFLIADGKISPEACRLYFIDREEEGGAVLQRLEVDHFGRIQNWPRHFFGDAMGETERQMARMMERMISSAESNR